MSVYFDYPSIRDFFDISGNTTGEKLDDLENSKFEYDRRINRQLDETGEEISETVFLGKIMI
jgi:hypothetical protein